MIVNGYKIRPYADLTGADLRGAKLRGANLSGANLSRADLSGANLDGASLIGSILTDAHLSEASLSGADLTSADLKWASLGSSILKGCSIDYSCLPLWRGGQGATIDVKIAKQLLAHALSFVIDDDDYNSIREYSRKFCSESHIARRMDWLVDGKEK